MSDMPAECAVIANLFPGSVHLACMRVQDAPQDICDGERPCIERAVEKRRREFSAGRCCARQALRQLGCTDAPIVRDEHGAPLWPQGVAGSITHTVTYAAAAVAESARMRGVGIDMETVSRVSSVIAGKILTRAEQAYLQCRPDPQERQRLLALIFSAKEAAYKCLHPLVQRRIGFEDARIEECGPSRSVMRIHLSERVQEVLPEVRCLPGRYCYFNDTVCTAVWLEA